MMKKIKLKIKPRQSGKTYKLVGKFLGYLSKGKHPIYLSCNTNTSKDIKTRLDCLTCCDYSKYTASIINWKDTINLFTDVIILDDYEQYKKKDLNEILQYAKDHNIKVIGYSSKKGE